MNDRSFRRSCRDRWVFGVCGGLASFLGLPGWMLRLALILLVLGTRLGPLLAVAYGVASFAVPEEETPVEGAVEGQPVRAELENAPRVAGRPWLLLGLVLIGAGVVALCREIWGLDLQKYLFPLFLVVVGVMLLVMAARKKSS